jgi:hypothetical protein
MSIAENYFISGLVFLSTRDYCDGMNGANVLGRRFRKNLRAVMKQQNLSQVKLADMLGLKQGRISKILNMDNVPTLQTVANCAVVLRVDPLELLAK